MPIRPVEVARCARSRRIATASIAASLGLHGGTIALAWWWGAWLGWIEAQPLDVVQGRASIALTASIAAAEASQADPQTAEVAAILPGELRRALVERAIGSPEPQVTPVSRRPTFEASQQSLPAVAELKLANRLALTKLQPAIELSAEAGGEHRQAAAPQAATASNTPRQKATVEIDSTAAVPSPASESSAGADIDQPARVVFNPAPVYPPAALAARQTGRVVLRVRVSARGIATAVSIHQSSGVAALDAAALAAVRNWRFRPAMRDGMAIERDIAVPVRFTLAGQ